MWRILIPLLLKLTILAAQLLPHSAYNLDVEAAHTVTAPSVLRLSCYVQLSQRQRDIGACLARGLPPRRVTVVSTLDTSTIRRGTSLYRLKLASLSLNVDSDSLPLA